MNSSTRINSRKLKFQPSEPLTVVNREYGLMRVFNDRSITPYPRASKGVDAETLRNRLSQHKHGDGSALMMMTDELQDIQRPTNTPPAVHIAISRIRHPAEHLLRGTPHPMKGKAVDPKLLIKNLESEKQSLQIVPSRVRGSTRGSIRGSRRSTFSGRSSINKYVPTPHPKKRIVLNPRSLIKRLTDITSETPSFVKKVGFISPTQSFQSFDASEQGSLYVSSDTNVSLKRKSLSFEERRRRFNMGEFTIAKNGKKLSGWPLSEASNPGDVRTSLLIDAEKANEEIELFMQKQGMAKAARNMVTNVRPGRRSQKRISTGSASSHLSATKASMTSLSLPAGSVVSHKRRVQI